MDFTLSEDQKMLKKAARDFLTKECPTSVAKNMERNEKGYPPQLYEKMAEMGWMGLPFPAKYGGQDGSFLDLVILLEEMGRVCLPGPYFSSIVLGGTCLLEGGNEEQRQKFLPQIAQGKTLLTLALTETNARYSPGSIQTRAVYNGEGYTLEGRKLFVPDAHVADYIVCVCRTGSNEQDITSFIVSAQSENIHLVPLITLVGDKQFEVLFDKVQVPRSNVLGELNKSWPLIDKVLQKAAVAKCAENVGAAEKVFEMTVDYAKQRIQFEHPIGSFEVIKHYCANMLIDVEGSRWITHQAAWMLSEGLPCRMEISAAKVWVNEAYERVAHFGTRIHGGVGVIVPDHDMPLYYKRAKQSEIIWGDSDFHREIMAQELEL